MVYKDRSNCASVERVSDDTIWKDSTLLVWKDPC